MNDYPEGQNYWTCPEDGCHLSKPPVPERFEPETKTQERLRHLRQLANGLNTLPESYAKFARDDLRRIADEIEAEQS